MLSVLNVIGTRPEAIKMAPVVKEFERHSKEIRSFVCVTAQHREMLDQVLEIFEIKPDFDLGIMRPDQTITQLTADIFLNLDPVVRKTNPDWIIAQGDTTTVLVASFIAFYAGIPFAHVEAGLRTGDIRRPFPEEMNRMVTDTLSELLFAPTERNRQALLNEGVPDEKILVTGNTVIDALLTVMRLPDDRFSSVMNHIPDEKEIVLITAHRRESFGKPLQEICRAIKELAIRFEGDNIQFVYPVHMNPNVRNPVNEILSNLENLTLLDPLDYPSLIKLMKSSRLILTDSGGIQEEAPSLGVPVLVMRDTTERPEGVEAGVSKLVGTDYRRIVDEATFLLTDEEAHKAMASIINPYGDGHASERIVKAVIEKSARK